MPEDFELYSDWIGHPNIKQPSEPTEIIEERSEVQPPGEVDFKLKSVPSGELFLHSEEPFEVRAQMRSAPTAPWTPAPVLRQLQLPTWTLPLRTERNRKFPPDQPQEAELAYVRHGQTTVSATESRLISDLSNRDLFEDIPPCQLLLTVEPVPLFFRVVVTEGDAPVSLAFTGHQIPSEDDLPAPRPERPAATSPERGGFFPWASGAPASEAVTAIRRARTGWEEKDYEGAPIYQFSQERPFDVEGQFNIIVPRSERALQAAEAEVAQRVLRDFGHRTARLHLACAAYATEEEPGSYAPVPRKYVYDLLGLSWDSRTDLSRDERDRMVEAEVDNLRKLGVQLTVLDGPNGREQLSLNHVWDLGFHKWGQRRAVPDERELDTDEWRLLIRPTAWAQLYLHNDAGRQFGYFSRALIENIDWHNNPAAGDLAIELLKYVRFQKGASRDLTVARILEICQLMNPKGPEERRSYRQKLERAILEQERWGWEIEWTRWPDAYRPDTEGRPQFPPGYWGGKMRDGWDEAFQKWKVTFRPPETLAEMNSRAKQVKNSAPHELEPKGWDDRIKAILDATNYSQAGLADTVEVSPSAISRWKNGDRTPGSEHQTKLRDIERRRGLLEN